jgi:hypothetical protein
MWVSFILPAKLKHQIFWMVKFLEVQVYCQQMLCFSQPLS